MGHMTFEHTQPYEPHFWENNRIKLVNEHVLKINTNEKSLSTESGLIINYDKLILATGSKPNKFGWKGQDSDGVSGMYSKQDLDYIEERSVNIKSAVIVGGGLIGIEMAEMFLSRKIEVHFFIREELFWNGVFPDEDSKFIMRHLEKHHGLIMHYKTELDEIITDDKDKVTSVKSKSGEIIQCQFVGLTAGVSANIDFVKESGIACERGIMINRYFETSVTDVYAIGDCAQLSNPLPGRRSMEQVWYTGKIMGETLAKILTGDRIEYNPGHWFNSAKFMEIEYQTYGMVLSKRPENQDNFIYINEEKEVLLHFVFEKDSRKFIGVNNFGLRLRHQVFNDWLLHEASIEEVLSNLKSANFDPEFYKKYEKEIVAQFNTENGKSISVEKVQWWQNLIKTK